MPKALFLIGIPASGKSTFTKSLLSEVVDPNDWVVISSDDIIDEIAKEQGKTYSEVFGSAIKFASKEIFVRARQAVADNKNVIWDQTNLNVKARASKIDVFMWYEKTAVIFPIPHDLDARLASRPGKNIPKDIIENMKRSYEEPSRSEGFQKICEYTGYAHDVKFR